MAAPIERRKNNRRCTGLHLIELLAALLMSGFLTIVLSSSLSEVLRLNSATDNGLLAVAAAQEVIERVRSTPYGELPGAGTYDVQVNLGSSDTPVASGAGYLVQRPLMLDGTRLTWNASQTIGDLPKNHFGGVVSVSFLELPVEDCIKVTVEVQWTDSTRQGLQKYITSTVVAKNGIMRHQMP